MIIQSQAPDMVGRIQGAVSTSRFLGMTGGAALALFLALTLSWQMLIGILTIGGLVLLGLSTLGPRSAAELLAATPQASPVGNIPD